MIYFFNPSFLQISFPKKPKYYSTYSTVTLLAKLRGLSTSNPLSFAA